MSDSISRHDVIQLIYNSYYNLAESSEDVDSMIEDVEALPSTDAPSNIVHCKECKNSHMTYGGLCKYCDMWDGDALYLEGDFYCGFGERRDDE